MKLQYMGTAAAEGWPAIFCQCDVCVKAAAQGGKNQRMRSGALVNDRVLLDVPPDLFAAKLKLNLDLGNVRNILVTHAHMDHFDRETLSMFTEPYAHLAHRGNLHVWGSGFTQKVWREYVEGSLMKEPELDGEIVFHTVMPFESFDADGIKVTALPAVHSCPESLIYVLEQEESKMLYGNDTGLWREEVWRYIATHNARPFSLVSLDSTMGLPESTYDGHMTFAQNMQVRLRMLREGIASENTIFICNHFSHNGLLLHEQIEELMKPKGFRTAYDGLIVEA